MVSSSGIKRFDLLSLPLTGRTLIEASAGTGKTYSLAFIYLRLLLGIGRNGYAKTLKVDEILVVTFTKAATEELRSRIRLNIYQLRMRLLEGSHNDPSYQQLIDLILDVPKAIRILTEALQLMDEAAIYTIHSFCQRILTTHAFESGILFNQTLVADEQQLRLQIVQDFWRNYFTPLDKPLAYLVLQSWRDPLSLLSDLTPSLNLESAYASYPQVDLVTEMNHFYQSNLEKINEIKREWIENSNQIVEIITQSDVSKQSYSNRNLPNWIAKVSYWAESTTLDFSLPPALGHFSQSVLIAKTKIGKQSPSHAIFEKIETLLSSSLDLGGQFLTDIAVIVKQAIYHEKVKRGEIGFDDLLLLLNRALKSQYGTQLAKNIAEKYCVAMIDEFQDTDPIQYQIFDDIYQDQNSTGLLFIGDPKQAIYSFRGADIFTYLHAKLSTGNNYFTMDMNWRSSKNMVNAVNRLFANHKNPFVFENIPFLEMKAADKNDQKSFTINNQIINAFNAYLLPDEFSNVDDYLKAMAKCCANEIVIWLSSSSRLINSSQEQRGVTASDIAILVRNKKEAEIMQQQLIRCGIQSVYLSNHNSVFDSFEAKELLNVLHAVLIPENESALRAALMTQFMGLSMPQIENIIEDQERWESLVEEFKRYQMLWLNYGILVMLRNMMKKRQLAENILAHQYGERRLTNVMHLGEILQEASYELDSPHALIRWLTKQISHPDLNLENHEQRLESDENLVKIITIHKSKGLEFPLVWLPFIANYRSGNTHFYHDKHQNYQLKYAWKLTDEIKQQIEDERLAEDMRLFYVAITRSIYHCSVGLAKLKKDQSAIHYLLNHDLDSIGKMANLIYVDPSESIKTLQPQEVSQDFLSAKKFMRRLSTTWKVTSYSELQKRDHRLNFNSSIENRENEDHVSDLASSITEQYDIHHFPAGAYVGTLLHKMMEQISDGNIDELSDDMLNILDLPSEWNPILSTWIKDVLSTPLTQQKLPLKQILQNNCIHELQFYLPIKQPITAYQLDQLCKKHDSLSRRCIELDFPEVTGMLKGFIDLVFESQGKFYIVDYKSNKLGNSLIAYQEQSLIRTMCEHRYDLQYQLYTLALHRFLKKRLSNYDYSKNFGGVYYLFLRGMPHSGIFYHLPDKKFIEQLDQLFEG